MDSQTSLTQKKTQFVPRVVNNFLDYQEPKLMTPDDFLKKTIEQYHKARLPTYPHERIFRGESRCISSEIEDLFARYLIENLSQDIVIFVNQIITTGSKSSRQRIKPDLIITKDESIVSILDLKMDLGYKREGFSNYWKERDAQIPLLQNQEFSLFIKSGSSKEKKILKSSNNIKLFFVIISDQNINKETLDRVLTMGKDMQYSDIFILSRRLHPNAYNMSVEEVSEKIEINNLDFDRLKLTLNQTLQDHVQF